MTALIGFPRMKRVYNEVDFRYTGQWDAAGPGVRIPLASGRRMARRSGEVSTKRLRVCGETQRVSPNRARKAARPMIRLLSVVSRIAIRAVGRLGARLFNTRRGLSGSLLLRLWHRARLRCRTR